MNTSPKICPRCQSPIPADAPGGLCPACLLMEAAMPAETAPGALGSAPTIDEVAAAFPDLEILELIGHGGMGVVFKARQTRLARFIALKILPPALAGQQGFSERFTREARALARLNHPNIVAVYDFGESAGFCYLLMEFVTGVNLRQAMRAGVKPEQALTLVPQICEALQFAHDHGVLHRDIKPENILLDTAGKPKLADFGIAKLADDKASSAGLTLSGAALGTAAYMAPEQIEKPGTVDHRADIYSLGVVLYEMLTGELPLGRFAAPSEKSGVAQGVDEVVMRALEKERERRQQTATQMKAEVEYANTAAGASGSMSDDEWMLRCPACGRARRLSDASGIRLGATSIGRHVLGKCAHCGFHGMIDLITARELRNKPFRPDPIAAQRRNFDAAKWPVWKAALIWTSLIAPLAILAVIRGHLALAIAMLLLAGCVFAALIGGFRALVRQAVPAWAAFMIMTGATAVIALLGVPVGMYVLTQRVDHPAPRGIPGGDAAPGETGSNARRNGSAEANAEIDVARKQLEKLKAQVAAQYAKANQLPDRSPTQDPNYPALRNHRQAYDAAILQAEALLAQAEATRNQGGAVADQIRAIQNDLNMLTKSVDRNSQIMLVDPALKPVDPPAASPVLPPSGSIGVSPVPPAPRAGSKNKRPATVVGIGPATTAPATPPTPVRAAKTPAANNPVTMPPMILPSATPPGAPPTLNTLPSTTPPPANTPPSVVPPAADRPAPGISRPDQPKVSELGPQEAEVARLSQEEFTRCINDLIQRNCHDKAIGLAQARFASVKARLEQKAATNQEFEDAEQDLAVTEARGDAVKILEAKVRHAEKALVRGETLHVAKAASAEELRQLQSDLNQLRLDLAKTRSDPRSSQNGGNNPMGKNNGVSAGSPAREENPRVGELRQTGLKLAEAQLEEIEERFKAGMASSEDLSTARKNLAMAKGGNEGKILEALIVATEKTLDLTKKRVEAGIVPPLETRKVEIELNDYRLKLEELRGARPPVEGGKPAPEQPDPKAKKESPKGPPPSAAKLTEVKRELEMAQVVGDEGKILEARIRYAQEVLKKIAAEQGTNAPQELSAANFNAAFADGLIAHEGLKVSARAGKPTDMLSGTLLPAKSAAIGDGTPFRMELQRDQTMELLDKLKEKGVTPITEKSEFTPLLTSEVRDLEKTLLEDRQKLEGLRSPEENEAVQTAKHRLDQVKQGEAAGTATAEEVAAAQRDVEIAEAAGDEVKTVEAQVRYAIVALQAVKDRFEAGTVPEAAVTKAEQALAGYRADLRRLRGATLQRR